MAYLLAFPVFIILTMAQIGIVSQLHLLRGTGDLVMIALVAWTLHERGNSAWAWAMVAGLLISFVSATPMFAPLAGYLILTAIVCLLRRQVWQVPLLAMFLATMLGTIIIQFIYLIVLKGTGTPLPWQESLSQVMLPSVLLNIILVLPVYVVITDLAHLVYPLEEEE
jgi:rod shape-determining protein MreD